MTRDQAIAWAAGLFEGEGCMTTREGTSEIHAALVMGDEDIVRRFGRIIGAGNVCPERRATGPRRRPMWRWQVHGDTAEAAITLLLPFFGRRRAARARELLDMRDRWRARILRERRCAQCGKTFRPKAANHLAERQRFCSRRCQMRATDTAYRRRTGAVPKGTATHCRNGHRYTKRNTYIAPAGHRVCRACGRAKYHRARARAAA